ncbi:MAG: hypothetical protein AT713_01515 [Caldivirga sp. JCHS_4]|nr:MAG: hypothetical protein AT713_01515 [Caldivirga sp. JCHS_4]
MFTSLIGRATAALEYLRQRNGEPESRIWERHDELYATWLMFRLADEFESYIRSGAGRHLEKETFSELLGTGRWLPVEMAPPFWLRLSGINASVISKGPPASKSR